MNEVTDMLAQALQQVRLYLPSYQ